jgi:hypothetical protein
MFVLFSNFKILSVKKWYVKCYAVFFFAWKHVWDSCLEASEKIPRFEWLYPVK